MEESRERSASEEFADGGRMLWIYPFNFQRFDLKISHFRNKSYSQNLVGFNPPRTQFVTKSQDLSFCIRRALSFRFHI